jgi:hypothetical protein
LRAPSLPIKDARIVSQVALLNTKGNNQLRVSRIFSSGGHQQLIPLQRRKIVTTRIFLISIVNEKEEREERVQAEETGE